MQRRGYLTVRQRGTLFVFLAAVLYSIGGLCIKVIPWNGLSINSARNVVALLVVGGYLAVSGHRLRLNRWIALGAVSVCGTNVLFSMANKLTTAANTIVLQFTAPIFVILLAVLFWRKKPERLDLAACALVLAGVFLGMCSSFLGIGGGPINVALIIFLFSYPTKTATVCSLVTILFAQISKLAMIAAGAGFEAYDLSIAPVMIVGAIAGGFLGASLNKQFSEKSVERAFNGVQILVLAITVYNIVYNL